MSALKYIFYPSLKIILVTMMCFQTSTAKPNIDTFIGIEKGDVYNNITGNIIRKGREVVIENVADLSVFYSLKTNKTIKDMLPRPWIRPGQNLRLPFIGDPCNCQNLTCGCCAGINITFINFNQKACVNVTYDPDNFALILDASFNNNSLIHNSISGKNPPPICIPIIIGTVPTGADFCIVFFDIYTPGVRNINFCLNFELRIISYPVLVLQFDCLRIGLDGIVGVKPQNSTYPVVTASPSGDTDPTGDIYDEVTEMKNLTIAETTIETITNKTPIEINDAIVSFVNNTIVVNVDLRNETLT